MIYCLVCVTKPDKKQKYKKKKIKKKQKTEPFLIYTWMWYVQTKKKWKRNKFGIEN